MPCATPLTAYQGPQGGPVLFNKPRRGQHSTFFKELQLPCGQCILCRLEHARQTAVRIVHEAQRHERKCFLTLTINDFQMNRLGSLNYARHVSPFYKRLRARLGIPLHHYTVGEYGEQTMRPHYHACLFGHDFQENARQIRGGQHPLWTNPLLEETWQLGNASVGILNFQTANYTAAYITKKLSGNDGYVHLDDATGEITWLEQPRAHASTRPAIGATWNKQWGDLAYAYDQVVIGGRPQKLPKYYDILLGRRSPIALEMLKEQRRKQAQAKTPAQLNALAINARAKSKNKKR